MNRAVDATYRSILCSELPTCIPKGQAMDIGKDTRSSLAAASVRKIQTSGPGRDRRTRGERRKGLERREASVRVTSERRKGIERRTHERRCGGAGQLG